MLSTCRNQMCHVLQMIHDRRIQSLHLVFQFHCQVFWSWGKKVSIRSVNTESIWGYIKAKISLGHYNNGELKLSYNAPELRSRRGKQILSALVTIPNGVSSIPLSHQWSLFVHLLCQVATLFECDSHKDPKLLCSPDSVLDGIKIKCWECFSMEQYRVIKAGTSSLKISW